MISSATQAETLCTTAVSSCSLSLSASSSFSVVSSSPQLIRLTSSPSSLSSSLLRLLSTFVYLFLSAYLSPSSSLSPFFFLLFLSFLFLPLWPLSPHRRNGSPKPKLKLQTFFQYTLVFTLALMVTKAGSLPVELKINRDSSNDMSPNRHWGGLSIDTYTGNSDSINITDSKNSALDPRFSDLYKDKQRPGTLENSFQGDQPPRSTTGGSGFPDNYGITQRRIFYLRAANDQYLQVYNGTIFGTWLTKPVLGLMESYSHNDYLLLKHRRSGGYLCMDEDFQIYLGHNPNNHDCHIKHRVKVSYGLFKNTYTFVKHQRYLGINCDPVSWVKDLADVDSPVRFWGDPTTLKDAKMAEKQIETVGETGILGEKCVAREERELRRLHKKLRQRWCWALPRMLKKKDHYNDKCESDYRQRCDSLLSRIKTPMTTEASSTLVCVCDSLREMLNNPRDAKRTCLEEKILLWVGNKANVAETVLEPNRPVIHVVAGKMLQHYNGIARRMRQLRCQKNLKEKSRQGQTNCRKRARAIKINKTLENFKAELIVSPDTITKSSEAITEPSEAFLEAIRKLRGSSDRRRKGRKRGRGRRHRKRKRSRKKNRYSEASSRTSIGKEAPPPG